MRATPATGIITIYIWVATRINYLVQWSQTFNCVGQILTFWTTVTAVTQPFCHIVSTIFEIVMIPGTRRQSDNETSCPQNQHQETE